MSKLFLTADPHFGHYNIVLHCYRYPWIYENPSYDASKAYHFKYNNPLAVYLGKHDGDLIGNWNSMVERGDTVIIHGDFAFKDHNRYLMALNGKKILIKGNHDKASLEVYRNFTEVHEMGCRKRIEGYDVTMCHYAMRAWASSCHNALHAYGHSHGRMPEFKNMLCCDVGVDVWGYAPVPWECFLEKMTQKMEWIRQNGKGFVDGEKKADGMYDKDPEQRVLDIRMENKAIMAKMGYPIDEAMWPNVLPPKFECKKEDEDDA